jgi:hypothetical protein
MHGSVLGWARVHSGMQSRLLAQQQRKVTAVGLTRGLISRPTAWARLETRLVLFLKNGFRNIFSLYLSLNLIPIQIRASHDSKTPK